MRKIIREGKLRKLPGGVKEQTFLVYYQGSKYVIRRYEKKESADYYMKLFKILEKYDFFPKLLYQDGRTLLFEYIKGRDCKKEDAIDVAFQVGKICAIINGVKLRRIAKRKRTFSEAVDMLSGNKLIDKGVAERSKKLYNDLKRKVKFEYAVEFDDLTPGNFRLRNGKVFLIDIENITYKIKGRGIGKGFLKWFTTPQQREKFKKGYESIASLSFLTEDYLKFTSLNYLIMSPAWKVANNIKLSSNHFQKLNLILEGKLK